VHTNANDKDVRMRIFFSVGEPSGDVHGANLIRALQAHDPSVKCVGFGGDLMAAAGCEHLFNLCNHPVMGFAQALVNIPWLVRLIARADREFRQNRPDAVVLIDYPGFNWWIARRAHKHGIPVFYFVPPQIWAWASWRVNKMRRFVDHVLCSLPFEEAWYRERGVNAEYVGHPFFDELPRQKLDADFLGAQREKAGTIIAILPGSRTHEVENNFATQLRAADLIHRAHPETRFLVAGFKEGQRKLMEEMRRPFQALPLEIFVGKTPEIVELSKVCVSVSGSVSLELLYRAKPTVIVYRLTRLNAAIFGPLIKVKYITLVNLLADKLLFPEFKGTACPADGVAREVLHWLDDERACAEVTAELVDLRNRVGAPGACERAAQRIVDVLSQSKRVAA
jgi:lipid-A-disaccharide synthase